MLVNSRTNDRVFLKVRATSSSGAVAHSGKTTVHTFAVLLARWQIVLTLFGPSILVSQEMPVPVRQHYPILIKALTFDRHLKARCGNTIVLGLLYQSRVRQSIRAENELTAIADSASPWFPGGYGIRVVPIDLSSEDRLEGRILAAGVNTLYVAPLRSIDVTRISAVARKNKILTLTGVPAYVEMGLSIGVRMRGGRPSLVINRPASKAEGADLDSQILRLARTIR